VGRQAKPERKRRETASAVSAPGAWISRLVRNILLLVVPVTVVWLLLTPIYNPFLTAATERLLHFTESPDVTRLHYLDHFAQVVRLDHGAEKGYLYRIRVTDLHFNLILAGALFLAVPGIASRRRWESFGWALLASVVFHLLLFFFFVKFVYATQLGAWSAAHYGAFGQNFWGLGKHLLDLPFKFALPFVLWAGFYFNDFMAHLRPTR
jgi:hypothetical protein